MEIKKKVKSKNILLPEAEKRVLSKHKTKINLWMDSETYRQLRLIAVEQGITVTSIISECARNYLSERGLPDGSSS